MTLELDRHRITAEDPDRVIQQAANAVALPVECRASDERDEAARRSLELVDRERAFAFRRAHLHARDQTAQILVALL